MNKFDPIENMFELRSTFNYAELLEVDAKKFASVTIPYGVRDKYSVTFGVRLANGLIANGYKTLKDVFLMTPLALRDLKNIGAKSVKELEDALKKIAKESAQKETDGKNDNIRIERIKILQNQILHNEPYSISDLNDEETDRVENIIQARDVLGAEFCNELIDEAKTKRLAGVMSAFSNFCTNENDIILISSASEYCIESNKWLATIRVAFESVKNWNHNIKSKKLLPFIKLFCALQQKNVSQAFTALTSFDVSVNQYPDLIEQLSHNTKHKRDDMAQDLNRFQKWMSHIDPEKLAKKVFDLTDEQKLRYHIFQYHLDYFRARVQGLTLEEIGQQYGCTRERVRQVVLKVVCVFVKRFYEQKYNLLLIISACLGGISIIRHSDIADVIGKEKADILWFILTFKISVNQYKSLAVPFGEIASDKPHCLDNKFCLYNKEFNAVVISLDAHDNQKSNSSFDDICCFVNTLPALVKTSNLHDMLKDIAVKTGLPLDQYIFASQKIYKKAGVYSYREHLTFESMVGEILKSRFANGYKIIEDAPLLSEYVSELFAEDKTRTARAFDVAVMSIGVLADRGKYVHPCYVDVNRESIEDVFSYIASSSKSALTYSELYEHFRNSFAGTVVKNRFALQGVMKFYNCPFKSHRDYVSKTDKADVADEFRNFIERKGSATREEILAEFSGWRDHNIGFMLPRCPEVLSTGNGIFIHERMLDIHAADYEDIRSYLDTHLSEIPVSSNLIFSDFQKKYPEFVHRNVIQTPGKLFAVLQYMFSEVFHFSRPYICKDDIGRITNKEALFKHLGKVASIEIDDITDVARKCGIKFVSIPTLVESLQPELIRINSSRLMRYEDIGLSDEIISQILDAVNNSITANKGYMAAASIKDFSAYPSLNVPWTAFLLESILNLFPDEVHIIKILTTDSHIPHSIFVGELYRDDDWESLVLRLIKDEHERKPFLSKTEISTWLQERYLCIVRYPKFLDSENHVYFDDSGLLMVR